MKSVTINLYPFDELNEQAKQKAIDKYRTLELQDNWYQSIYDDANEVGIRITGFALDYKGSISLGLNYAAEYVAEKIKENHGETCDTYKSAESFQYVYKEFLKKYRTVPGGGFKDDAEQDQFMEDYENITQSFITLLKKNYLKLLQQEYDYRSSDAYTIETIQANDYLFFQDGHMAYATHFVGNHPKAGQIELKLHGETYLLN